MNEQEDAVSLEHFVGRVALVWVDGWPMIVLTAAPENPGILAEMSFQFTYGGAGDVNVYVDQSYREEEATL